MKQGPSKLVFRTTPDIYNDDDSCQRTKKGLPKIWKSLLFCRLVGQRKTTTHSECFRVVQNPENHRNESGGGEIESSLDPPYFLPIGEPKIRNTKPNNRTLALCQSQKLGLVVVDEATSPAISRLNGTRYLVHYPKINLSQSASVWQLTLPVAIGSGSHFLR